MLEVVELYVVMHCEACAASVKRAVKKIPGVESYMIDFYEQKVTVTGDVNREDVWRRILKTGKRATLIPKPDPPKEEEKKEEEKKVEETVIQVEEKKQEETKVVEEVKVHETKEEVVTVVDTKEKAKEETKEGAKDGAKEETKKEEKKKEEPVMRRQLEWVPMFVTAPYYTLPSRFY